MTTSAKKIRNVEVQLSTTTAVMADATKEDAAGTMVAAVTLVAMATMAAVATMVDAEASAGAVALAEVAETLVAVEDSEVSAHAEAALAHADLEVVAEASTTGVLAASEVAVHMAAARASDHHLTRAEHHSEVRTRVAYPLLTHMVLLSGDKY